MVKAEPPQPLVDPRTFGSRYATPAQCEADPREDGDEHGERQRVEQADDEVGRLARDREPVAREGQRDPVQPPRVRLTGVPHPQRDGDQRGSADDRQDRPAGGRREQAVPPSSS